LKFKTITLDGRVWRTDDGGKTWINQQGAPANRFGYRRKLPPTMRHFRQMPWDAIRAWLLDDMFGDMDHDPRDSFSVRYICNGVSGERRYRDRSVGLGRD